MRVDAIVAEGLAKMYGNGVWGARDITFTSGYGEIVVLLGPNGSGKTTTINMLATLIKPTKGRGFVGGFDIVREAGRVRGIIALMPQDGRPDLNWSPYEAVKWYLVARGLALSRAEREARRWLEELGLWDVRHRPGWELSGGQLRRTLAAMALASGAPIVFLDEPTTGVDVEGKHVIWSALRRALGEGRAILYTTHDMREAEIIADKVVIIGEGRSVAIGSPRELIERLPFKYKVIVRNDNLEAPGASFSVRMGDTLIAYYESRSEAIGALADMTTGNATIEQISLEDAYIYYTRTGGKP